MILFLILILWISCVQVPEGQMFRGMKYHRDNKTYSHLKKRKKDATGRYYSFVE